MPIRRLMYFACLVGLSLAGIAGCGPSDDGEPIHLVAFAPVVSPSPVIHDIGGDVPALVKFSLAYTNEDHHVWAQAVGGMRSGPAPSDPNTFILKLEDGDTGLNNPRDPVRMSATYLDLEGISPLHVTSDSDLSDVARLPLDPPIESGELFVLCGFSFQTDGSNHHLRVLRITPRSHLGYVEVEYRDDSPGDDLYRASVAYAVVPAGPAPEGSGRLGFLGPHQLLVSFTGGAPPLRLPGTAVLHGFHLQFRDGDRHLNDITINLGSHADIWVSFADGDPGADDFVDARVSYVLVSR